MHAIFIFHKPITLIISTDQLLKYLLGNPLVCVFKYDYNVFTENMIVAVVILLIGAVCGGEAAKSLG